MTTVTPKKIYLDVCCLCRPYDDRSQMRIRLEADAILGILNRIESREWDWVVSEALLLEVGRTPDNHLRERTEALIARATSMISIDESLIARASFLETRGFRIFDALHLACAESGLVDVFLTTDDKLIRMAGRLGDQIAVRVANPLRWLEEETGNMSKETLSLLELQRAGLDALRERLGLAGMIRFIQQFESGKGDYTTDRHEWLDGLKVADIRDQLDRLRGERDDPQPPSSDS